VAQPSPTFTGFPDAWLSELSKNAPCLTLACVSFKKILAASVVSTAAGKPDRFRALSDRANKPELLLQELIALASVNPAFLPAGHARAGEHRVADFLAATAARAGLEVEFQTVLPNRSNLLARLRPPKKPRHRILLAPHMDTVDGNEAQFLPLKKDGKLFGRGACDTKGSVAAMLSALADLARDGRGPAETEILFTGLVDEENAQMGSRALVRTRLKADLAIVGEPTNLQVITAHKGSLWLKLETRGKSVHGSVPELGKNAVHEMARVVEVLETDYAQEIQRRRHPLLGTPTVSVGSIAGGTQANIVPDRCTIMVDRRTLPGETEAGVRREIQALLRRKKLKAVLLNGKTEPCLPLETNPRSPMVARFLESIGQSKPVGVRYFCDAAVLAQGGIPSVAFGPGDIAEAHTANEWIAIESLNQAKRLLVRFLQSLP
jgi:acetylornithine deacetylase/succinyl-diaminopimelate desuccinylase-like protein